MIFRRAFAPGSVLLAIFLDCSLSLRLSRCLLPEAHLDRRETGQGTGQTSRRGVLLGCAGRDGEGCAPRRSVSVAGRADEAIVSCEDGFFRSECCGDGGRRENLFARRVELRVDDVGLVAVELVE